MKRYDGKTIDIHGSTTRNEGNWKSTVFEDGQDPIGKRTRLAKEDAGAKGLYGDFCNTIDDRR